MLGYLQRDIYCYATAAKYIVRLPTVRQNVRLSAVRYTLLCYRSEIFSLATRSEIYIVMLPQRDILLGYLTVR